MIDNKDELSYSDEDLPILLADLFAVRLPRLARFGKPRPRAAALAQRQLQHESDQRGDAHTAGYQPQLAPLQRLQLAKRAENVGRGVATAAKAIDGEQNELTHDPKSMRREIKSNKLMTRTSLLGDANFQRRRKSGACTHHSKILEVARGFEAGPSR